MAAACSPLIGIVASSLQMVSAMALADRRGIWVLAVMLATLLAAEDGFETAAIANPFARQAIVALMFGAIVGWYRLRRRLSR